MPESGHDQPTIHQRRFRLRILTSCARLLYPAAYISREAREGWVVQSGARIALRLRLRIKEKQEQRGRRWRSRVRFGALPVIGSRDATTTL